MSRGYRGMISIYKVNDIPLIGSIVNSGLLHLSSWSSLCLCLKGPKHSGVQTPTQSFLQVHLYEYEGRRRREEREGGCTENAVGSKPKWMPVNFSTGVPVGRTGCTSVM